MNGLVGVMTTAFGEGADPKALHGMQGSRVGRRREARVTKVRRASHGKGSVCALCPHSGSEVRVLPH